MADFAGDHPVDLPGLVNAEFRAAILSNVIDERRSAMAFCAVGRNFSRIIFIPVDKCLRGFIRVAGTPPVNADPLDGCRFLCLAGYVVDPPGRNAARMAKIMMNNRLFMILSEVG